ncbi:MAG: VPS10 domain-containing protein [Bacteroidales bacterium]
MKLIVKITLAAVLLLLAMPADSQRWARESEPTGFEFRNLGAFRINAWVGEFAIPVNPGEKHKYTWYAAARAGGVWKTVNNGTTFECISDELGTNAIGDVELAPSDHDILWIGTGEDFNARSSYYGNGIWKSTDAGETWEHMGLEDSHHIAEIIIHPDNPDIVWVAVMGHLYSDNEQRGLFKTTDGGLTWEKKLYIDESTGIIDIAINSQDPDILYASAYDMERKPWTFEPGGERSRLYKSEDGGESWNMITGGGLPDGPLGRIGIDVQYGNPDVVVAVVQNLNPKPGEDPDEWKNSYPWPDQSMDNLIGGECYRSFDGGETWERLNDPAEVDVSGKAGYSFNKICVDPQDPDKIYIIGASMYVTLDGGDNWLGRGDPDSRFTSNFGDNRSLWIDPLDGRHMFLGSDGGVYQTWDGGKTTNHYYQIPLGEVYMVEVDNDEPYNIYFGLQDHESWKAPSNNWSGRIGVEDYVITGYSDGMYTRVDPEDNRWLYHTSQFGMHHRENQAMGERERIEPVAPEGEDPYRFTWNTPIMLSPHNSSILYAGAQKLLRSPDRGETWEEISPDLTTNDMEKIAGKGHVMYCTITSMDESTLKPGLIWVGTDDGKVHITRNHGADWEELTRNVKKAGLKKERWVARIIASEYDEATAYLAYNGYRNDDFRPYLYKTSDYGRTWEDISSNLPDYPINVVYEDTKNPDLLFVGNDNGVFYTLDGAETWKQMKANIPPVVVRDLLVHPRENDLVVGTYGRAVWVGDISPLQQFTDEVQDKDFHLFDIEPKPQMNYSQQAHWGNYGMMGSNHLKTPNEENGLELWYYFKNDGWGKAKLTVTDMDGEEVYTRDIDAEKGMKRVYWNTYSAEPGIYNISMTYEGQTISKKGEVKERWIWPVLNYRR